MSGTGCVMIHVQHLLGIGHLQRALGLAASLTESGFQVVVASGGKPTKIDSPAGIQLFQLDPLHSLDGSFDILLDQQNQPIGDRWRESRCKQLLGLFHRFKPQILITETFPFGRRMLRFELLPLLEAARQDPNCQLIVSSIRDVLQPKSKPGREEEVIELIERYYDRVLIHGDKRVSSLGDSFAEAGQIADKVNYSGYIARSVDLPAQPKNIEVLVSAGGSDRGLAILTTAIATRPASTLADHPWRILVSHAIADSEFTKLTNLATDGIVVERNRRDFPVLLANARLSIFQAGYNTMTDLLATRTPAVVVPFAEAGEREQSIRAGQLRNLNRVAVLPEQELSVDAMATAIDGACQLESDIEVDLNGAQHSAGMISNWYNT